jgi:two-component system, NarL family, response regulator NreC
LVAEGYTNKEIGVKLRISEKTVETYKTRSMSKLNIDSRVEVIRYARGQVWLGAS